MFILMIQMGGQTIIILFLLWFVKSTNYLKNKKKPFSCEAPEAQVLDTM